MFVQIKDYPNYFINENGECKSNHVSKPIKPRTAGKGYLCYQLRNQNGGKNKYIHRLVAETFIPNPDNLPIVDHIDGNKKNNHVSNLRWVTNFQNLKYYGFDKLANFSKDSVGVGVVAIKDDIRLEFKTKTDLLYHFGYETNRTRVKIGEPYQHGKLKGYTVYFL